MRRLIWAEQATADLIAIDEYLMSRSPAAAVRTLEAIGVKARLLEQFPAAGPILSEPIRVATVVGTPDAMIYQLDADAVHILRVRHEREDWR